MATEKEGDDLDTENIIEEEIKIITTEDNTKDDQTNIRMLYVLVHGNHGQPTDWIAIKAALYTKYQDQILILASSSNSHSTHEGIEVGGRNLACEVANFLKIAFKTGLKEMAKIKYDLWAAGQEDSEKYFELFSLDDHSDEVEAEKEAILVNSFNELNRYNIKIPVTFIGHSLGGLYSRNAIGWLYEHDYFVYPPDRLHGILIPFGIVTICSPHLGSRRPGGTFVKTTWKHMVHTVLNHKNGHTGIELLLEDHININHNPKKSRSQLRLGEENSPLLVRMTTPNSIYMKALAIFRNRTLVGVTHFDNLVPFSSACVVGHNPYSAPKSNSEYQVVGYHNFIFAEHENIIKKYLKKTLSLASSVPNLHASQTEKVLSNSGGSIIGITLPNKGTTLFTIDTSGQVEYYQSMVTNFHSVTWRFFSKLLSILIFAISNKIYVLVLKEIGYSIPQWAICA